MGDEGGGGRGERRNEEFELEVAEGEDYEAAVREALEAVERASGEPSVEGEGGGPQGEEPSEAEADRLRRQHAELKDRWLRTLADFDNFRKRVERERHEERRFGAFEVCRDLLSVADNLERAAGAAGSAEDVRAGVTMILKQVHDLLRRHGVERLEAEGRAFDPALHDAVSRQEEARVAVPTVSQELQAGYLFHDRLLRPATVTVTMPVEPPSGTATEVEDAERGSE